MCGKGGGKGKSNRPRNTSHNARSKVNQTPTKNQSKKKRRTKHHNDNATLENPTIKKTDTKEQQRIGQKGRGGGKVGHALGPHPLPGSVWGGSVKDRIIRRLLGSEKKKSNPTRIRVTQPRQTHN